MAEKQKPTISKPIYRTDSAYTKAEINFIPQPHHEILLEKLTSVLEPIGAHRRTKPPKKASRGKKRKRAVQVNEQATEQPESEPPIQQDILVGFNSVNRHLKALSSISAAQHGTTRADSNEEEGSSTRPVAALFLLRPSDDLIFSHLPLLCYTASLAKPQASATRLISLDLTAMDRVVQALGVPRSVSLLAVLDNKSEDSPAKTMIDYARQHVEAVEVPWLKEALEGKWLGTKIDVQQPGTGKQNKGD